MKGISPLVAAVLLIGVTMTIAGALAFWVSGFVHERVRGFGAEAEKYEKCLAANFAIYSSLYNSSDKTLTIVIENRADIRLLLTDINILLQNGTVDVRELNETLPKGGAWFPIKITDVDPCQRYRIVTECPEIFREGIC